MKKHCYRYILTVLFVFFFGIQAFGTDLTVFGLTIGEKFDLMECSHPKGYYTNDDKKMCFRQNVPFGEKLTSGPFININTLSLFFPLSDEPDITIGGTVMLRIINSNLEGVLIRTSSQLNQEIINTLKKKYGDPTSIVSQNLQNSYGANFEGILATWVFPELTVTYRTFFLDLKNGQITIYSRKYLDAEKKRQEELDKAKRKL